MSRCASPASPRRRTLTALVASTALSGSFLSGSFLSGSLIAGFAPTAVATFLLAAAPAAQAQIVPGHRYFPQRALRGELIIGVAPDVKLNGKPARLAPGARIRNAVDLVATPGSLYDQKLIVLYTRDISGLILDVWVLNDVELANKTWPTTVEQAAALQFDQASQVWRKP